MSKAKQIITPPMRRVPADKDRPWPEYVDPIHEKAKADGWIRLCEILEEAMQDKTIAASSGAAAFLELMAGLAANSLTAENNIEPLQPVIKEFVKDAEDKAKDAEDKASAMKKSLKNHRKLKRAVFSNSEMSLNEGF